MSFGDAKRLLSGIASSKVKSFAAQAKALDISEFQDLKLPKRRTLLLCLLHQAQVKTRDHKRGDVSQTSANYPQQRQSQAS